MLETSKDLLYVVISFSVLWFTIFFCWMIYYLAMILRDAQKITHDVRRKFEKVDEILTLVKAKIEKSSSHLTLLVTAVKQLVKHFETKKSSQRSTAKKKR